MKSEWEVIVVGTGMGGATLGYQLAKSGKEVLFLEQGRSYLADPDAKLGNYAEMFFPRVAVPDQNHREILQRAGRWCDVLEDTSNPAHITQHIPFLGAGIGGSSAIYGAAMERFFPEDFNPGASFSDSIRANAPSKWPIQYETLLPYYRIAEELYRVRGGNDPLRTDPEGDTKLPAPEYGPANQSLANFLEGQGLHPYRLPLSCEFVPGCGTCQGFLCANDCKIDSVKACLRPAIELHDAELLDQCKVTRLEADSRRVHSVICDHLGDKLRLVGDTVVLAAGALVTPAILLRSTSPTWPSGLANKSGLVGRNLMRHCIDLYAVQTAVRPSGGENIKELAFNDYYIAEEGKLGTVQSFGRLPPSPIVAESIEHDLGTKLHPLVSTAFKLVKPAARLALESLVARSVILASTLEDLPSIENRAFPSGDAEVSISYTLDEYAKNRIQRFRKLMNTTLRPLKYLLIKQAENNDRIAHVCGTCRFGTDPSDSVLDMNNRAHDIDNLFVVDASFFPTSAGTNPSLTIAANALRVADHMLNET